MASLYKSHTDPSPLYHYYPCANYPSPSLLLPSACSIEHETRLVTFQDHLYRLVSHLPLPIPLLLSNLLIQAVYYVLQLLVQQLHIQIPLELRRKAIYFCWFLTIHFISLLKNSCHQPCHWSQFLRLTPVVSRPSAAVLPPSSLANVEAKNSLFSVVFSALCPNSLLRSWFSDSLHNSDVFESIFLAPTFQHFSSQNLHAVLCVTCQSLCSLLFFCVDANLGKTVSMNTYAQASMQDL